MSPVARALTNRERCAEMIAEAIEAERARCLRIARAHESLPGVSTYNARAIAAGIAADIERGTP